MGVALAAAAWTGFAPVLPGGTAAPPAPAATRARPYVTAPAPAVALAIAPLPRANPAAEAGLEACT